MMCPNPRFPHHCTIYRKGAGGDAFSEGEPEEIIYEGECRCYVSTRNIGEPKVQSSQYTIAIPAYQEITYDDDVEDDDIVIELYGSRFKKIVIRAFAGDKVRCTDARGEEMRGTVVDCYAGTKGNNVYWNYDAN